MQIEPLEYSGLGDLGISKQQGGQAVGSGLVAVAPMTGPAAPFVAAAGAIISVVSSLIGGGGKGGPAQAKGATFDGALGPGGLSGQIIGYSANQSQQFQWPVPLETANAKGEVEARAPGIREELANMARVEGMPEAAIQSVLTKTVALKAAAAPYQQIWPEILAAYKATLGNMLVELLNKTAAAVRTATQAAAAAQAAKTQKEAAQAAQIAIAAAKAAPSDVASQAAQAAVDAAKSKTQLVPASLVPASVAASPAVQSLMQSPFFPWIAGGGLLLLLAVLRR